MDAFLQLFGAMLVFTYHCFDRVVINGYISVLSRPGNVVYFFHEVVGVARITREVLMSRTRRYQNWVEAFARNHGVPIEWAEKGVRKEDAVRPYLRRLERKGEFGVYFIYKSMEQGTTFRSVDPKYATSDPDYRILKKQRIRFTHYYFYIRDETLGPMIVRVASFLPFHTTTWLNGHNVIEQHLRRAAIAFRKNDNAFTSVSDPAALQAAADRLTPQQIGQRMDYWIFLLGPKFSRRERSVMGLHRFYAIAQVEYCHNFVFRRNWPIRRLFERACELGLARLTAPKIAQVFGWRVTRAFKGKLQSVLERIDHGHHVLRAYFKNSFVKQYEKLRTFLRMEVCSNHLPDLRIKKSLENLPAVRQAARGILDRFATLQGPTFNVHFDFPLLQRLALPIAQGKMRLPGIKLHDTRIIRLMETLLHAGSCLDGWTSAFLHHAIVQTYTLRKYTINQLRYDLRKMKAHGLIERNGRHYTYRLTDKGVKVAVLFVLFHKRLCGPLANSLFHHRPQHTGRPTAALERAYHKADATIQKIVDLLEHSSCKKEILRAAA